jgi:hypothetical protein
MKKEHIDFLEANIGNWHTAQAGFIRNLELDVLKMYEHIFRLYLDPNFVLTIWCGDCKYDMIKRLYKYYEAQQSNAVPIASFTITETGQVTDLVDEKPKKRGRPKK